MRRSERAVTDRADIVRILDACRVCHLALCDGIPYVVPMCYGYVWDDALRLYLHGAPEGRRMELIASCADAGFAIDRMLGVYTDATACSYTMYYESIIGEGRITVVTDVRERELGLRTLLIPYGGEDAEMPAAAMARTAVLRLDVTAFAAKRNAPPAK